MEGDVQISRLEGAVEPECYAVMMMSDKIVNMLKNRGINSRVSVFKD